MASRLDLHSKLEEILGNGNVYFQSPGKHKMSYPCIIYKLDKIKSNKANNKTYKKDKAYTVTLIHSDPDNELVDILLDLPYCEFDRHFESDNLHHYVYTLYF